MSETIAVSQQYGAIELKAVMRKYMMWGLFFSSLICLATVGAYYLPDLLFQEEEPVHMVRIMKYSDLGPPPSLSNQAAPAVAVAGAAVRPSVGTPVPVPDAEVSPEQTIMSQTELSQQSAPAAEMTGGGAGEGDVKIEDDGPPPEFVPYEKEPVIVKQIKPAYPDLALRAGLEGNVFVKVWVDKEGKVRKALILKSDNEIFNDAALAAAREYVFTPAVMQKGPVSVWVAIPFRFRLTGNK